MRVRDGSEPLSWCCVTNETLDGGCADSTLRPSAIETRSIVRKRHYTAEAELNCAVFTSTLVGLVGSRHWTSLTAKWTHPGRLLTSLRRTHSLITSQRKVLKLVPVKMKSDQVTWASMPRKDQLLILCFIRIAEPIMRISVYVCLNPLSNESPFKVGKLSQFVSKHQLSIRRAVYVLTLDRVDVDQIHRYIFTINFNS